LIEGACPTQSLLSVLSPRAAQASKKGTNVLITTAYATAVAFKDISKGYAEAKIDDLLKGQ